MNSTEELLLKLIKESQFGDGNCSFDNIDYNALISEAECQSVLGLVLPLIPKAKLSDSKELIHRSDMQIAKYIKYTYAEDQLHNILREEGISFVILKGNAAAIYYLNPVQRTMGDIDFLVTESDFEQTKKILTDKGFSIVDGSESHPRHIAFSKYGIVFEMHRRFSHHDIDIEDIVKEGFSHIVTGDIDGHSFPMLPPLANGLVLLDHMRNHLKKGLGLRQAVDWMMYVNRELDDIFWESQFSVVAREKRMDKLAIVATRMCQIYMGLPDTITWCKEAEDDLCSLLMDNLLTSGNFGRKRGSGYSVEYIIGQMKKQGNLHWLQKMGEHNWETYHKHHCLKPFCWAYQGFRYLHKGIKTGRSKKQLNEDISRSEQRLELLKRLGID